MIGIIHQQANCSTWIACIPRPSMIEFNTTIITYHSKATSSPLSSYHFLNSNDWNILQKKALPIRRLSARALPKFPQLHHSSTHQQQQVVTVDSNISSFESNNHQQQSSQCHLSAFSLLSSSSSWLIIASSSRVCLWFIPTGSTNLIIVTSYTENTNRR